MPKGDSFSIFAPAKVNLFLHITGRRDDGYHTLQSLMAFAATGDILHFAPHDDFALEVRGPFARELSAGADNIVHKAARALAKACGVPLRGKITLEKNLPVAAGLGGGSADGAATLRGLAQLWNVDAELPPIALSLGADVPACLAARALWAEGIGEEMFDVTLEPLHAVLVNPGVPVPTAEVFRKFAQPFSAPVARHEDFRLLRNDLSLAACATAPVIHNVLEALAHTLGCRLARLSGSGATCFGLFDDATAAAHAAAALQAQNPAWWIMPTHLR